MCFPPLLSTWGLAPCLSSCRQPSMLCPWVQLSAKQQANGSKHGIRGNMLKSPCNRALPSSHDPWWEVIGTVPFKGTLSKNQLEMSSLTGQPFSRISILSHEMVMCSSATGAHPGMQSLGRHRKHWGSDIHSCSQHGGDGVVRGISVTSSPQ